MSKSRYKHPSAFNLLPQLMKHWSQANATGLQSGVSQKTVMFTVIYYHSALKMEAKYVSIYSHVP
jgi:hypothetical protein